MKEWPEIPQWKKTGYLIVLLPVLIAGWFCVAIGG